MQSLIKLLILRLKIIIKMETLQNIRSKIGYSTINRKLKTLNRRKDFNNFRSAKSIGVVFNATEQDLYKIAINFFKYLAQHNINVTGLGYVTNDDMLNYFPHKNDIAFFSIKKVNWHNKPKSNVVDEFIEKPMDIVINLCLQEKCPIQYIIALSQAKMKISPEFSQNNYSDLRFRFKENVSLEYYIDQIKQYMTKIEVSVK